MDLRGDVPARERVLAGAFRMLDRGSLRVGSERYTNENGSHGLATLLCAHVLDHFSARETIDPPAGRTRPNRNCARCCTGRAT
jgi:DNA topoisomerase-1